MKKYLLLVLFAIPMLFGCAGMTTCRPPDMDRVEYIEQLDKEMTLAKNATSRYVPAEAIQAAYMVKEMRCGEPENALIGMPMPPVIALHIISTRFANWFENDLKPKLKIVF